MRDNDRALVVFAVFMSLVSFVGLLSYIAYNQ